MMSKSRSVMMPPGCQIRLVSAIRTAGLPLDVVEIAVGAPDRERLRRIQKHAIERFDALELNTSLSHVGRRTFHTVPEAFKMTSIEDAVLLSEDPCANVLEPLRTR